MISTGTAGMNGDNLPVWHVPGAALAGRQQEVFVIGGETKPGIRTAQICKIVIE